MKTPEEIIKGQAVRYVDSYQVGDGANTLTTAVLAALAEGGYKLTVRNPCRNCPGCGKPLLLLTTPLAASMSGMQVTLTQEAMLVHESTRRPQCDLT